MVVVLVVLMMAMVKALEGARLTFLARRRLGRRQRRRRRRHHYDDDDDDNEESTTEEPERTETDCKTQTLPSFAGSSQVCEGPGELSGLAGTSHSLCGNGSGSGCGGE